MAVLQCPKCGCEFPAGDGLAKVAVATLMAAPAIPDMATQVRCPACQHLFAEGDVRYLRSKWHAGVVAALAVLGMAVIAWMLV